MKNVIVGFLTAAVALLALSGFADPVRLLYGKGGLANYALYGESQYAASEATISNLWAQAYTDGRVPHAGADYLLAGGSGYASSCRCCLGDSSRRAFLGNSLQLGVVGGAAFNLHQRKDCYADGNVYTEFKNLILAKGSFYWLATYEANVSTWYKMTGAVTVNSPASAPFEFYSMQPAVRPVWRLASNITGASGTGLRFYAARADAGYGVVYNLQGDNSAYSGSYEVTSNRTYLCFSGNAALGANVAADAIKLSNGGGVGGFEGAVTLSSGAGVTVEATGGTFYSANGCTVVFSLPVTGEGAMRVEGGGSFVLNGDYRAGAITVAADTLFVIGPDANLNGAHVYYEGGATTPVVLPIDGSTNKVDFSKSDGARIVFNHDAPSIRVGCAEFTGIPATWPLAIEICLLPTRPAASERFPILRIPTSLKTVTADDFFFRNRTPYAQRHWVETDGDMQVVCVEFPKILQSNQQGLQWGGASKPDYWTDGSVNYLYGREVGKQGATALYDPEVAYVDTLVLSDIQRVNLASPFCGSDYKYSLSFAPTKRKGDNFAWKRSDETQFSDLRLYGYSCLFPNAGPMIIAGGLVTVAADASAPAEVMSVSSARPARIRSRLAGDGVLRVGAHDSVATDGGSIFLEGDNSRFLGTVVHNIGIGKGVSALEISDNSALGGNPATFTADAVRLSGTGDVLRVTADVTMPHANRGITTEDGYVFEVATGKTFRVMSRVTINGKLTKTGAGRLILDDVAVAEGAELAVSAGEVVFGCAVPEDLTVTPADAVKRMAILPASGTATYPSDLPAGSKLLFGDYATGCLEIKDAAQPDFWPMGVVVMRPTDVTVGASYPILKIPTSVREVTLDDFYSAAAAPQYETLTLTTAGSMQTLCVSFPEVLTAVDMQNGSPYTVWKRDNGQCITNPPTAESPDYAYRLNKKHSDQYRLTKLSSPFAGQSFSVGCADGTYLRLPTRANGFDFANMRLYPNSCLARCVGNSIADILGDITVNGTEALPAYFEGVDDNSSYNGSFDFAGILRGDGYLCCRANLPSTALPLPRLGLSGDNSTFLGTLDVTINPSQRTRVMFHNNIRTNNLTLEVSSATALGGALPAFDAKSVRLGWSSTMRIQADVTLPANRGLYVYDSPCVDVGVDHSLAVVSRTTVNGTLEKAGGGTLTLGDVVAEDAAADEAKRLITVTEGALVVTGGVENVKIAFSDSFTLSLSRRSADDAPVVVNTVDDLPFGSSGAIGLAWNEGEEPTYERWKVEMPIMKVKTSAVAGILSRLSYPKGALYEVSTKEAGEGLTVLMLGAKIVRGTSIIVR